MLWFMIIYSTSYCYPRIIPINRPCQAPAGASEPQGFGVAPLEGCHQKIRAPEIRSERDPLRGCVSWLTPHRLYV